MKNICSFFLFLYQFLIDNKKTKHEKSCSRVELCVCACIKMNSCEFFDARRQVKGKLEGKATRFYLANS